MPPVNFEDLKKSIETHVKSNNVAIFSKTTCPFCAKAKALFQSIGVEYGSLELNELDNGAEMQDALQHMSGQRTVPNIFIRGQHLGGCDDAINAHKENRLLTMVHPPSQYDYDLVVIGGGSGGLASAKQAADLGKKVACLDFVKPSPQGTAWGLGGTCVNVGCIPKKLMHQAALLGHSLEDSKKFGWQLDNQVTHNWDTLKSAVQDHIGSLNWNYRVQLRSKNVTYMNTHGEFIDAHKIKAINKRGKVQELTSEYFILATGGRPRIPNIPGSEYFITSDDLFSLPHPPGRTLVIGASYVALECAGFLSGLGYDVTVMVRSILLRGFDQQMAERIGDYMQQNKIRFIRPCVPTKVEKLEGENPAKYSIFGQYQDRDETFNEEFQTVMVAVGRDPCTSDIGLDKIGLKTNPKTGFVLVDDCERTNIPNVFAIGDICEGKPELTPVAIQAGRLLANRLFNGSSDKTDYTNVATTVFTPLEYGAIGITEEQAVSTYGEEDVEVYHSNFWPLEWTVAKREDNICYAKLICIKSQNEKVVGFHVLSPNAGEITQGFSIGLKMGAGKADFDRCIGIHPTCAEIFTTLSVTKSSGEGIEQAGC